MVQSRWPVGPDDDDDDATIVEGTAASSMVDDGLWSPEVPSSGGRPGRIRHIPPRQVRGEGGAAGLADGGAASDAPYQTVAAVPLASEADVGDRQRLIRLAAAVLIIAFLIVAAFLAGVWWAGRGEQAASFSVLGGVLGRHS